MKVLYDYQIFTFQRFGGISRSFHELMRHSNGLFSYEISGLFSNNIYIENEALKKFMPGVNFKGQGRIMDMFNKVDTIRKIRKNRYDIFHPTYYDPYIVYEKRARPLVLTVYDMIHERFFQKDHTMIRNKRKMIIEADKIIAISENTKRDILEFNPEVPENKIAIAYHGTSFPLSNESIYPKEDYILFVGRRRQYKNFDRFVTAVAPLLIKYDLGLVCTGLAFSKQEKELMDNLQIYDRAFSRYASEKELYDLYSKALVFVFPSLYEGFGNPVLEAFACGCPAILANVSSLPEIGGDAAVYFDPYDVDDMRSVMDTVITSPSLQRQLIIKGKERVKCFSWTNWATETARVYNSVLK